LTGDIAVRGQFLSELEKTIADRANGDQSKSYTRKLLDGGPKLAGKKFGEEAFELALAAVSEDQNAVRAEAADVLYHLLVLLRTRDVQLDEVIEILERRTAQSGLEEKASRGQQ
jgi:phosphoribosyl-ATP pyrophosphohydrolase